tara:strand:+ start:767 stop:1306 length:540 start_codon:yes stop_codon:yes gene_type:complete
MIMHDEWLVVGLITSPQGINGEIKIKSLSDFEERFIIPGKRWIQKDKEIPRELELTSGFKKPGKESFIITFREITNRNQAENLKGYKVLVKVDSIPKLNNDEFHLTQLVNLEVKISENNQLKIIGKIINLENERNNLLVIQLSKNNKKVLIPFVKEIVPVVDIKNKFIIITPPSGLLEL